MAGGRPLKFKSVKKLQQKIDEYFDNCDEHEKPYGIVGLAVHLDTTRNTLIDYQGRPEFSRTIEKAKERCQAWVEQHMLLKGNAGAIFWMKNHGWQDKKTLEVNDITELSKDQLLSKLDSLIAKK